MGEKKNKVLELSKQEPKLSRSQIARAANCSAPFVTQILGTVRAYKRQPAPESTPEMCPGCEDQNCVVNGCLGA